MRYDYTGRSVWIDHLDAESHPATYDMCGVCSEKMTPPRGWDLTDARDRRLFEASA